MPKKRKKEELSEEEEDEVLEVLLNQLKKKKKGQKEEAGKGERISYSWEDTMFFIQQVEEKGKNWEAIAMKFHEAHRLTNFSVSVLKSRLPKYWNNLSRPISILYNSSPPYPFAPKGTLHKKKFVWKKKNLPRNGKRKKEFIVRSTKTLIRKKRCDRQKKGYKKKPSKKRCRRRQIE